MGETQGLCLLGIVQLTRGAISSKVDFMTVARPTVDDSGERGEFMSGGTINSKGTRKYAFVANQVLIAFFRKFCS